MSLETTRSQHTDARIMSPSRWLLFAIAMATSLCLATAHGRYSWRHGQSSRHGGSYSGRVGQWWLNRLGSWRDGQSSTNGGGSSGHVSPPSTNDNPQCRRKFNAKCNCNCDCGDVKVAPDNSCSPKGSCPDGKWSAITS